MKYLFDTNAVIYLLTGVEGFSEDIPLSEIYISVISKIELLSKPLSSEIEAVLDRFIKSVSVQTLSEHIVNETIRRRRSMGLKTPDAIIAATAAILNLTLVTADKQLIKKCGDLGILNPLQPS